MILTKGQLLQAEDPGQEDWDSSIQPSLYSPFAIYPKPKLGQSGADLQRKAYSLIQGKTKALTVLCSPAVRS